MEQRNGVTAVKGLVFIIIGLILGALGFQGLEKARLHEVYIPLWGMTLHEPFVVFLVWCAIIFALFMVIAGIVLIHYAGTKAK
jgi:predicted membrane protein